MARLYDANRLPEQNPESTFDILKKNMLVYFAVMMFCGSD